MSDLVKRLRDLPEALWQQPMLHEAAAAIERKDAALRMAQGAIEAVLDRGSGDDYCRKALAAIDAALEG